MQRLLQELPSVVSWEVLGAFAPVRYCQYYLHARWSGHTEPVAIEALGLASFGSYRSMRT